MFQMREDFDQEKKRAVNVATRSLERDLERLKADHATEMDAVIDSQKREVSDIKKKQWVMIQLGTQYLSANLIVCFSVIIVKQRLFIGAAGIPHIAP